MTTQATWPDRLRFFVLGTLVVLGFILLTGGIDSTPPPNYGRYQLQAWAGPLGSDSGGIGAFVIDTATGETRTVYSRIYGNPGEGSVVRNNLNKPFAAMN